MASLTNMKLTKSDQKAREAQYAGPAPDEPRYPWGLTISLDEESLDKLPDMTKLPTVDDELLLVAKVKVTSVSSNDSSSGKRRSVSLQITEMDLEAPGEKKADAEILFKG